MNISNFLISMAQRVAEPLNKHGFIRFDDDLFVRFKDSHEINVISIQKHSIDPKVCLNFGVHYDFLPKVGSLDLPDNNKITISECEIKVRITPNSQKDYWWSLNEESIFEIADLIERRTEDFFNQYNIPGALTAITPEDLEKEMPEILSSITKVRASLILASIYEIFGELNKASNFAKYGIKSAGMAVGPKKMLKEILKRTESII